MTQSRCLWKISFKSWALSFLMTILYCFNSFKNILNYRYLSIYSIVQEIFTFFSSEFRFFENLRLHSTWIFRALFHWNVNILRNHFFHYSCPTLYNLGQSRGIKTLDFFFCIGINAFFFFTTIKPFLKSQIICFWHFYLKLFWSNLKFC